MQNPHPVAPILLLAVIPSFGWTKKTYPSLSRLEIPQSSVIFRPTWPMYMKFVEIICDVDRKKAHTHPTRHLTINGNKYVDDRNLAPVDAVVFFKYL